MGLCVTLFLEIKEKKGRPSRGRGGEERGRVLVYFRNELNKVVSVFDKSNENILPIKIGKNSLNNKSNTYIACVYNSPKNSTLSKENKCNNSRLLGD